MLSGWSDYLFAKLKAAFTQLIIMRYQALATDYDGTLAKDGNVTTSTLDALQRLRESGRKLILITGRQLEHLCQDFHHIDLFDCLVLENGAVVHFPAGNDILLGDRPSAEFLERLRSKNVDPLSIGQIIVASWEPHQEAIAFTIQELGLNLEIILNKGAIMVLPKGVNKAAGLKVALSEMDISQAATVAVGDAENDLAFMNICGFSVAVANALPEVKEKASWVTKNSRGEGVTELIEQLITSDLQTLVS